MENQQLFELLGQIDDGEMIPGTVIGKFYTFKGIQKYPGRGRFSNLKGRDVVVLESKERKRPIILFPGPLLLLLDGNSNDLAYGRLPDGYVEKYRTGESNEIPNLYEYESHYKALARHIKSLISQQEKSKEGGINLI